MRVMEMVRESVLGEAMERVDSIVRVRMMVIVRVKERVRKR